jgi:hypothetical protein
VARPGERYTTRHLVERCCPRLRELKRWLVEREAGCGQVPNADREVRARVALGREDFPCASQLGRSIEEIADLLANGATYQLSVIRGTRRAPNAQPPPNVFGQGMGKPEARERPGIPGGFFICPARGGTSFSDSSGS